MKSEFEQLMTGLDEVETFLAGNQKGFKVHVPDEVDVKSIRNRLKMTQLRFSDTFASAWTPSSIGKAAGGLRKRQLVRS